MQLGYWARSRYKDTPSTAGTPRRFAKYSKCFRHSLTLVETTTNPLDFQTEFVQGFFHVTMKHSSVIIAQPT